MKSYVLDTCALVAFFNDENGADVVENLLIDAIYNNCIVTMNKYNLLEAYYGYLRTNGEDFAENILSTVENSCIKIFDVLTDDLLRQAGKLKVAYKISLADAIALAQAAVENAIIVTSDHHELDTVEQNSKIQFLWIR
ncbi:MAG: PIN domain-containing protein [Oscillospiraceae bacterium]|nr:PIN domain-containing protein [Oscillospiraceae bacterium]